MTKLDHNRSMISKRSRALWVVAALLAVNAVLIGAQAGLALPRSLGAYFFGPNLVRAEVVVRDDGLVRLYRIDRGAIRDKSPGTLTLRERDATIVSVPIAPTATITINGRLAGFRALQRGMIATVIREGDAAASEVRAVAR